MFPMLERTRVRVKRAGPGTARGGPGARGRAYLTVNGFETKTFARVEFAQAVIRIA